MDFEVVVERSDLVGCLVGAALAMRGYSVCLLEPTRDFGHDQATVSLSGADVTVLVDNTCRAWLDLDIKLVPADSGLTQILLSGGVSSYLEFRGVDAVFIADKTTEMAVPLTKSDVFASPHLEVSLRDAYLSRVPATREAVLYATAEVGSNFPSGRPPLRKRSLNGLRVPDEG